MNPIREEPMILPPVFFERVTSCTKRLTWSVTDGGISKNDPYKSCRPSKNINLSIFCFFENRAIFEIFLGEKLRGEVMAGIF